MRGARREKGNNTSLNRYFPYSAFNSAHRKLNIEIQSNRRQFVAIDDVFIVCEGTNERTCVAFEEWFENCAKMVTDANTVSDHHFREIPTPLQDRTRVLEAGSLVYLDVESLFDAMLGYFPVKKLTR